MEKAVDGATAGILYDSPYGLAGAVWSGEINRALKVATPLEAGTVWINIG